MRGDNLGNKVRGLALALGYDPIETTRLATAVSEAARELTDVAAVLGREHDAQTLQHASGLDDEAFATALAPWARASSALPGIPARASR